MFDTIVNFDPIYKRDTNGKVRVWIAQVGFNIGSTDTAGYRSISGLEDGAKVTHEWDLTTPKNVGRSNATNAVEQAYAEANASRTNKLERGYFLVLAAIDSFDKFRPMLAHKYEETTVDFPTITQPKLDGIRCIARKDGLWTRQGKEIVSCPHISKALEKFFSQYPEAILDGELYNHDLKDDFNKITSLVRKTKPTEADTAEAAATVQYHVYDFPSAAKLRFSVRMEELTKLSNWDKQIIPIVQTDIAESQEQLDEIYGQYLEDGYEGQMVRLDKPYESKRSKSLLKRKEFITDEFHVVETLEGKGNWRGYVKRFVLQLPDGTQFGAGVRGNQATLKAMFDEGVKPTWATLRYFTPTPDGIPRFPVVIDWGFGDRED
jgi:DNA ligase-1